jgi:hypothetical protein
MKTLQMNLAVTALFLLTSIAVNAQTNSKKSSSKQQAEEKNKITLLNEIPSNKKASSVSSSTKRTNARVSEYLSMEKKIILWSVAGEIPSSFPKHVEGQTKEQYIAIIKAWGKNNLGLIKKEYHNKILSNKKSVK